jgi:CBS domain-containing protein
MRTNVVALPANAAIDEARELIQPGRKQRDQQLFPVVDEANRVIGVVSRNSLLRAFEEAKPETAARRVSEITTRDPVVAFTDEPVRVVVYRMVESGFTRFPVTDPEDEMRLVGMVSLDDLLRARTHNLKEERARERLLRLRMPLRRRIHV